MGSPPGGPERLVPPELVSVTPESGATNVRARGVMFEFDVVVNDRDIANYFLMSPREGTPRVIWRRDRVEVRPRRDFRPNTAYSVTLLPGLADLRGNAMKAGKAVVFSTGPTMPAFMVAGRVFDWMGGHIAANALVEVIRRPDSLPFVGAADSTGQFAVGPLDEGTYTVRALLDNNKNRAIDPGEPWDSVSIAVRGTSPFLELLLAPRDTIAPRLLTVQPRDSVTLSASFDRVLHPDAPFTVASVRVVRADSTPLRVAGVMSRARYDSIQHAARDTATRTDSSARRDSTVRRDSARVPVRGLPPGAALPPARVVPPEGAALEPKPSRPAPIKEFIVVLDSTTPVRPLATYRVTVTNIRGLLGGARTSDRVITVPPPRRDSTPAARRDSTTPTGVRPP
jgi:hypothetical protein